MMSEKNLVVSQHNTISQTARAEKQSLSLTVYQKRFLLLLISHINKDTKEFAIENIGFDNYCEIMNIPIGGNTHQKIKSSILDLCNKNFLVDTSPTKTEVFSWIDASETEIDWENKTITTKLGKKLKEYYIGLSEQFTSFQLGFTVGFRSKYSYRLYEYLRSYANQGIINIRVEKAYEIFCDNKYTLLTDLERFVLKRALEEINEHSDIHVTCSKIKSGRKTTHLAFNIKIKPDNELEALRLKWAGSKQHSTAQLKAGSDSENMFNAIGEGESAC